ncbi:hypothetical protein D1872_311890 [compost metagenome]
MIFTVASGTDEAACIIDLVAWSEQCTFRASLYYNPCYIPAQYPRFLLYFILGGALLDIDRIYTDCPHMNQKISASCCWSLQLYIH